MFKYTPLPGAGGLSPIRYAYVGIRIYKKKEGK